ncbi:hypothetical protein [Nocardia fluminea]|uniref:hypothetical protein n=1 Tax=Nocardia fluminea TaxID=134984 RepID=UPI003D0ABAD6
MAALPAAGQEALVLEASTKEEFSTVLLPRIAGHSQLSPTQIAVFSGLVRSTAYNYADPGYNRFPQQVDKVRSFCHACGLSVEQVARVETIWDTLNGTKVVVRNGEQTVVEAELLDPKTVRTTAADQYETAAGSGHGNSVIIGGTVRGDLTVNTVNHFVVRARPSWGARTLGGVVEFLLMVMTFATMSIALDNPHLFALDIGWFMTVPVLLGSSLLLFLAALVLARRPARPSLHEIHVIDKRKSLSHSSVAPRIPAVVLWLKLERILSAHATVTGAAALLAGFTVGVHVHIRDIADDTWDNTEWQAPVLSGLLVGLAVLALVSWWRVTFHILVVRFIAAHFPVLGVVVVLLGALTTFASSSSRLALPIGCALITGLFVATTAWRLFIAAVAHTILYPALRTYFGEDDNPVGSRYQGWIREHEEIARTRVERLSL